MRELLHLFGIHHWSKWSEAKIIGITQPTWFHLVGNTLEKPESRDIVGQERSCLICNKKEARETKVK